MLPAKTGNVAKVKVRPGGQLSRGTSKPTLWTTEAGLLNFQVCLSALLIHPARYNQNGSEEFTLLLILKSQTERGAQICSLKDSQRKRHLSSKGSTDK